MDLFKKLLQHTKHKPNEKCEPDVVTNAAEEIDYGQYRPYITQEDSNSITISAEGWTKIIHDTYDEVIKESFGMSPIGERCWADEYHDGRRRCISVYLINNSYATLKWGWNFEYIPKRSGNKLVWCRTDKTLYTHTYRFSELFINRDKQGYHNTTFSRLLMTQKPDNLNSLINTHKVVWDTVVKEIQAYYEQTSTYKGLIDDLCNQLDHKYYRFVNPENSIVYAFVERYVGNDELAQKAFEEINFTDENIKEEYYKRFLKISSYLQKDGI